MFGSSSESHAISETFQSLLLAVNYFYPDGSAIVWKTGFPDKYAGFKIIGANAFFASPPFANIVMQEILTLYGTIRLQAINWLLPVRLTYECDDAGVHMRTVFDNHLVELVKGAGTIEKMPGELAVFLANTYKSKIKPVPEGELISIDTIWSAGFLKKYFPDDRAIDISHLRIRQRIPDVMAEPNRQLTSGMRMILRNIFNCRLTVCIN